MEVYQDDIVTGVFQARGRLLPFVAPDRLDLMQPPAAMELIAIAFRGIDQPSMPRHGVVYVSEGCGVGILWRQVKDEPEVVDVDNVTAWITHYQSILNCWICPPA